MKYEKPEVLNLGAASQVIQGGMNKTSTKKENGQDLPSIAAYEADE
jgi:hypothetical protein